MIAIGTIMWCLNRSLFLFSLALQTLQKLSSLSLGLLPNQFFWGAMILTSKFQIKYAELDFLANKELVFFFSWVKLAAVQK